MRTKQKLSALSTTREDYLRAIYLLQEKAAGSGVTSIAQRLALQKSTVSERVRELAKDGLVIASPYAEVLLTPAGEAIAKKLTYKHRVIEVFLHEVLQLPENSVHAEAEKLEHACSDVVIKKLAQFLKHPKTDPHGTDITPPENW